MKIEELLENATKEDFLKIATILKTGFIDSLENNIVKNEIIKEHCHITDEELYQMVIERHKAFKKQDWFKQYISEKEAKAYEYYLKLYNLGK